jgi:hypothetical protein
MNAVSRPSLPAQLTCQSQAHTRLAKQRYYQKFPRVFLFFSFLFGFPLDIKWIFCRVLFFSNPFVCRRIIMLHLWLERAFEFDVNKPSWAQSNSFQVLYTVCSCVVVGDDENHYWAHSALFFLSLSLSLVGVCVANLIVWHQSYISRRSFVGPNRCVRVRHCLDDPRDC